MWFLRSAAMLTATLVLASCAASRSNEFVWAGYKGDPKTVVLATSMGGDNYGPDISLFTNEMEKALRACRLEVKVVGRVPVYSSGLFGSVAKDYTDLEAIADAKNYEEIFEDAKNAPEPTAIIVLSELKKGSVVHNRKHTQDLGRSYRARFFDIKENSLVWNTEFSMPGDLTQWINDRESKARQLAGEVMSGLAKSGVLKRCPT